MTDQQSQKNFEVLFAGRLHHAYLLEGEAASIVPQLRHRLESKFGITSVGNPDFHHLIFESMGVDEARALRESQQVMSLSGGAKIFLIEVSAITNEAQNALLKIFEEPTEGTHFFLVMPSRWLLLPTVRSRLQIFDTTSASRKQGSSTGFAFMKSTPAERLVLLAPILEEKDKAAALALVDDLISYAHQHDSPHKHAMLNALLYTRQYVNDRSASLKLLLEHLALTLPPLAL